MRYLWILAFLSTFIITISCSNDDFRYAEALKKPKIPVLFRNLSQFQVDAIYVHLNPLDYSHQDNQIEDPLAPDGELSSSINSTSWYVTVFRKKNDDAANNTAFTTAFAWDTTSYNTIEYLGESFRVSNTDF